MHIRTRVQTGYSDVIGVAVMIGGEKWEVYSDGTVLVDEVDVTASLPSTIGDFPYNFDQ